MVHSGMPIIILAGSDRRASALPPEAARKRPLTGYKGFDLKLQGQPLIVEIMRRLRACEAIGTVWVAGPRRVYQGAVEPGAIIDTDASVAANLRCAIATIMQREPNRPVGFTTCDILPIPSELTALLEHYQAHRACAVWYPLIRAPANRSELKAFAWKPEYALVPAPGASPVHVLPGHLVIANLEAVRLPLIYRLLSVAYRTRNRPIAVRRSSMMRSVLWQLVLQDLRHLVTLRLPNLTWTVLRNGLELARDLKAGTILLSDLERAVTRIAVKFRYRRRFPERGVLLPVLDALSVAEDADTEEEAHELHVAVDQPPDTTP